jgi:Uncharacterized protein conserved in bacteria (DUF2155)
MMRSRPLGALVLVLAACAAPGCRERGRPDPNIHMAISHDLVPEGGAGAGRGPQGQGAPGASEIPTRLEVPPEVIKTYSGIKISWKDKSDGKTGSIDVPLGGGVPLPDPSLVVRADVFLPAFTMGGGAITSDGVEPQNPAARITIFDKGKEIFGGWIFTRFPDVHPFVHPRYQLHLEGGVPKASP